MEIRVNGLSCKSAIWKGLPCKLNYSNGGLKKKRTKCNKNTLKNNFFLIFLWKLYYSRQITKTT